MKAEEAKVDEPEADQEADGNDLPPSPETPEETVN